MKFDIGDFVEIVYVPCEECGKLICKPKKGRTAHKRFCCNRERMLAKDRRRFERMRKDSKKWNERLRKMRETSKKWRERKNELGLCIGCGGVLDEVGYKQCSTCRMKNREYDLFVRVRR